MMLTYLAFLSPAVGSLRDQLAELKKKNQNSHLSAEKNIHLERQVGPSAKLTKPLTLEQ